MSFNSWLQNLKSTCGLGTGRRTLRRSPCRQPAARPRLQLEALEDRYLLSTFTVVNTLDGGAGSFRDAITQVNADTQPGIDTINFAIGSGVQTIVPLSSLPTITHPVVIDGTTQPGFAGKPLIELNGASAGTSSNGLAITAGNSTVKDLVINRFSFAGINLGGTQGGSTLVGNYLGTDVSGTQALFNYYGVEIFTSTGNTIGGTTPGEGNLISGNGDGIWIYNSGNNLVLGIFIGTDVTGTKSLTSGAHGIAVSGGSGANVIGGTTAGAGNLISGNYTSTTGIRILNIHGEAPTTNTGNLVEGNYIGTDVTGTKALGGNVGVEVATNSNTIGGTTAGARNLISGNKTFGLLIDSRASGTLVEATTSAPTSPAPRPWETAVMA